MPKKAEYQIVWTSTIAFRGYELLHGPFSYPLVPQSSLELWLDHSTTFHFCSPTGQTFTLRREVKQRGTGYWYGYKRVNGRVEKKYIGEKNKVTLDVLEAVARHFAELASPPPPPQEQTPPPPPPPPPRTPTLKFERSLQSALQIYGFLNIPARQDLINKYRELSKKHHPDVGGMHEDQVAINLAFDYLKKFL
jgi:hypothetical protein